MTYFTERNGMRRPIERTNDIDPEKYGILFRCCERYFINIAYKFPQECEDGCGCCGFDKWKFAEEIKYEIPDLFRNDSGEITIPVVHRSVFNGDSVDEYNQYALLDFIEFVFRNVRDVVKKDYHSFFKHYHYETKNTKVIANSFRNEINAEFSKTGLLYILNEKGQVERVINNDVANPEIIQRIQSIKEIGTRELLQEALALHRSHDPTASRDATEKIWDAFERLKTYYTALQKNQSAEKIVHDIAAGNDDYISLFDDEFKKLTKIGNEFRIRHHETNKIEVPDNAYYDYFFNRCLSLIALAIQYLE